MSRLSVCELVELERRGGRFCGERMSADALMVLVNGQAWAPRPETSVYRLAGDDRRLALQQQTAVPER